MPQQFEFSFSPQESGPPVANPDTFENLSDEEIAKRYADTVGINPKFRGLGRKEMIAGIKDPQAELERLRDIDTQSDKEELKRPYAN